MIDAMSSTDMMHPRIGTRDGHTSTSFTRACTITGIRYDWCRSASIDPNDNKEIKF